ncbi:hypothetical protein RJ55_05115 [Drechmeria coniospora]|nr:hypothetical protein RJ55_05115 [Drechmeria coniospora]
MTLQTLLYGFTLLNAVSKPYFDELLRNSVLLLAFLTGIAALSILWHTASVSWKRHNITESTLAAALSELTEVREMLFPKRNVLRVLEAKERDSAPKYLLQPRWMKSFSFQRKQDEEAASLRVEVSDLEARETFLTSSLALMRSQHADIMHTSSTIKKILQPWFLLMIYCFYRVILAPLALGWRTSFLPRNVPYDPLNLLCGAFLHAKLPGYSALFWASTLNIGLCSVILVAGVNPVIAAFHHVARWIPGLLKHATADIKLALGHVSAIFVISGLFYLRNMPMLMPTEKSGDEPSNIMSFEYWFLAGSAMSALAVGLSHKTHFGGAREQRRSSHDADLGGIKIM